MFTYLSNIALDIYYGYVEVKCVNPLCNRVFKLSRNNVNYNISDSYSCNMGCALNYFNHTQTNKNYINKEIIYYNDNHNDNHNDDIV